MAWVTVDQARPGMTLAAPVTDRMGRLLIPAGADLSERHVGALATWGVDQIEIEADEAPVPEVEIPAELEAQAQREVAGIFRHAGEEHEFLSALTEIAVARRARALTLETMGVT